MAAPVAAEVVVGAAEDVVGAAFADGAGVDAADET